MNKEIGTSTGLLIVFAAAVIIGGGSLTYFYVSSSQMDYETVTASATNQNTITQTKGWKTYQDPAYNFSFQYKEGWSEKNKDNDDEIKNALEKNKDLLAKIYFYDKETQQEIDCLNQEFVNYTNGAWPTKEECAPILAKTSKNEKRTYVDPNMAEGLYVTVVKNNDGTDLKTWLTDHNRAYGGELQDYTVGKEITMAGIKGYASQTACCAGYNFGYVIQKGNLIYELGTYYQEGNIGKTGMTGADQDNSLVKEAAENFQIK